MQPMREKESSRSYPMEDEEDDSYMYFAFDQCFCAKNSNDDGKNSTRPKPDINVQDFILSTLNNVTPFAVKLFIPEVFPEINVNLDSIWQYHKCSKSNYGPNSSCKFFFLENIIVCIKKNSFFIKNNF